ncbi:hypothetical protein DAI22_04g071700 [Oryza sativa Japonica Group]|nr:hypothetical protein DAI22_04g071700 [Oryza sativa Japonica Group]
MSVLGGCRILQDTPSPFHVHRGQGHLAQALFPHFDNACWCCVVACVQVLDKQHHERFHSPSITSSFDMFCSLSPVLLSFLHFFHAHGFRSDQNHGCMIRKLGKGTGGYIAYSRRSDSDAFPVAMHSS